MTGLEPLFGAIFAGALSAGVGAGVSALASDEPPKAPDPLKNTVEQQAKKFADARLRNQINKFGTDDTNVTGASRVSGVKKNLGAE